MAKNLTDFKRTIPLLGCIFLVIIILHLFPVVLFQSYILNSAFENLLHPYGFACVAVVFLHVIYPSFHLSSLKQKIILVMSTVLMCIIIGLTSEIIQYFFNRDASLDDMRNDVLGSVSGALLFLAMSKRSFIVSKAVRNAILIIGILILGFTSVLFVKLLFVVNFRNHQYPTLFNFEHQWEKTFINTQSSSALFVKNEKFWPDNKSVNSMKIDLHDGEYPGVSFSGIYPDWSQADTLIFALYSLSDSSDTLFIRIDDRDHNYEYTDRFNAGFQVNPGSNHYTFLIKDIANSLKTRTMNMTQVETVILFGLKRNSGKSILLDSIRLNR